MTGPVAIHRHGCKVSPGLRFSITLQVIRHRMTATSSASSLPHEVYSAVRTAQWFLDSRSLTWSSARDPKVINELRRSAPGSRTHPALPTISQCTTSGIASSSRKITDTAYRTWALEIYIFQAQLEGLLKAIMDVLRSA